MLDTSINVKTDNFDGPLSLLLMLIQKEEMSINNLDLTVITRQYLNYINQMRELNFNVAGDYLYLAATLILLKSKSSLGEEQLKMLEDALGDSGITSRAELIRRLEELKKFQKISENLWKLPRLGHEIFVKPKVDRKSIINSILTPIDLEKLVMSMSDFLRKNRRKYTVVKRDRISIKEKLIQLKAMLKKGDTVEFNNILGSSSTQQDDLTNIIISFISVLELARLKKLSLFQNEDNKAIYINVLDSLENFDVDLANGFGEEEVAEKMDQTDQTDQILEAEALPATSTVQGEELERPELLQ